MSTMPERVATLEAIVIVTTARLAEMAARIRQIELRHAVITATAAAGGAGVPQLVAWLTGVAG